MNGHCWVCDSEQEYNGRESTISLSYGFPHPILYLSVKSILTRDGEIVYFICEKCSKAILQKIADSKEIWEADKVEPVVARGAV